MSAYGKAQFSPSQVAAVVATGETVGKFARQTIAIKSRSQRTSQNTTCVGSKVNAECPRCAWPDRKSDIPSRKRVNVSPWGGDARCVSGLLSRMIVGASSFR
jgi:hypothetical protein